MPKPDQTLNRRSFLKQAAALGATLAVPTIIPASARGADGFVAPSNRIVMGCIGVGAQGTSDMRAFLGFPQVQVVAVCDVDSKHAAAAQALVNTRYGNKACKTCGDFREITRRTDIDAVTVVTPDHWHTLVALDAACHGKDMYVEKPLTLTIEEGRVLRDTVRRHDRILQTGSQQRSSQEFRTACELVRNGRIGRLERIAVVIPANNKFAPVWHPEPVPPELDYEMWLGQAPWEPYSSLRCHYNFRFIRDYSGGQVTNWGAHHIDIAQWALGMDDSGPVSVTGRGQYPPTGLYNTASDVFFECTYASGVTLTCLTSKSGGPGSGANFYGSAGTIRVERGVLQTTPVELAKEKIGPEEINLPRSRDHHGNFLECIRSRQLPIADVAIGHRSATVCHLGNIAMELGRKLQWDPQAERFVGDDEANRLTSRALRAPWKL